MAIQLATITNPQTPSSYMLDTGSPNNYIHKDHLEVIGLSMQNINHYDRHTVQGIGKQLTQTCGSIWVKLIIGESTFPIKFHVLDNMIVPAIIGLEFLKNHTSTIGSCFDYITFQRFPVKKSTNNTKQNTKNDYHKETINEQKSQRIGKTVIIQAEAAIATCGAIDTTKSMEQAILESAIDLDAHQDCDFLEYKNHKEIKGPQRVATLMEKIDLGHLNSSHRQSITDIISEFKNTFFIEGDRLTRTDAAVHDIETETCIPINKRQYRFPEATKKHIKEQVEEMLEQGIIKPSTSPWNAPVLCIPKKPDANGNQKYRMVVDYRALNTITRSFVYPIPLINEILDNIGENSLFTCLDLKSGFYQVSINPNDTEKTAFSTPQGHFEFVGMAMGLKNAPSTFQKLMHTVVYELGAVKAFVYLDDIIVFGNTVEDHNDTLKKVLDALSRHNLKIEPAKCQMLKTQIEYLGHIIDKNGIRPTDANIKAITNLKRPTNIRQVRSFLGTINFYGKFISNIAARRKPLNDLLKKGVKFSWTPQCERAFEDLKQCLISEPLLIRPNYKDTFVITTDASDFAIGAVLSNAQTMDQPIAFASRALKGAELRYHAIEKELLAIVWATQYFRHYIFNQKFIVYTDHRPLVAIDSLKETSTTLSKLRLKLLGLDREIRYKQGRENAVADFLSRIDHDKTEQINPETVGATTRAQLRNQNRNKLSTSANKGYDSSDDVMFRELSNIDISDGNEDLPEEEYFSKLYEEFRLYAEENKSYATEIKNCKTLDNESNCSHTFVIANKKSGFSEISQVYNLPHGARNIIQEGNFAFPNDNLYGVMLDGKHNSIIDSKKFFQTFALFYIHTFSECANKRIHLISFRKIRQPEILQIIEFAAWKTKTKICFYNNRSEIVNAKADQIQTILQEFHDAPLGGHIGSHRMIKRISQAYFWKNMNRDILNYVRQCDSCQRHKIHKSNKIPMKITTTASEPFEKLYMDIVMFPESHWGNNCALTVQDDLTRFLTIIPIHNQEASTVARALVEGVICKFGTPCEIVTDQGTNFMSKMLKEVCKLLHIKKINTSAYHPQANLVERSNRELKQYMRQFVGKDTGSWDQKLPYFLFEYNTAPNESTGFSPYELLYGRVARMPASIYKSTTDANYETYLDEIKHLFSSIHKMAKENLAVSKVRNKIRYDVNVEDWQPELGDPVMVHDNPMGMGRKLQQLWRGPYLVIRLDSEQTSTILNGNKEEKVHNNRLKKYND